MCPPRCYRRRLQLESKAAGIDARVRGLRLHRRQARRFSERLSRDCVAAPYPSPRRSSPGNLRSGASTLDEGRPPAPLGSCGRSPWKPRFHSDLFCGGDRETRRSSGNRNRLGRARYCGAKEDLINPHINISLYSLDSGQAPGDTWAVEVLRVAAWRGAKREAGVKPELPPQL
jgi:hypothetical protein